MPLRELAPDLWVAEQPLRFLGLEVGTRMTIVRCPGSRLFLHSPILPTPELTAQVERLGAPAYIVAPNRFHHLYAGHWRTAYPHSRLFVAPGVETKRRDLNVDEVLGPAAPSEWSAVIDQALLGGFPLANEVVFFHRPSGTMIASDLVFNIGADSPGLTRAAFRMLGSYGKPSSTLLERFFIRDRAAFRRSLDRILGWPVARLVVAHGEVVEKDVRPAIEAAYSWMLA